MKTNNCSSSEAYAFHPAVVVACILVPLLNAVTIGFSAALIRLLVKRLAAHPISNYLSLNAALAALFTSTDMFFTVSYGLIALITGDACYVAITKQVCAIQYARMLIGLSMFNLSLIAVGFERAVVGTRSYVQTCRREAGSLFPFSVAFLASAAAATISTATSQQETTARNQVGPGPSTTTRAVGSSANIAGTSKDYRKTTQRPTKNRPSHRNSRLSNQAFAASAASDGSSIATIWIRFRDGMINNLCCISNHETSGSATMIRRSNSQNGGPFKEIVGAILLCLLMWLLIIIPHVIRVAQTKYPDEQMDFCTGQQQELVSTHLVSVVFNLASLAIFAYASAISKYQLRHFATSQTHFSLEERSELRYNLHVTYMIGPVIIHTCVCVTLNSVRFLAYNVHDSLDPVTAHIINIYIFLLVNYSPLLFYAAYGYRSFRILQLHGPSLVITLPTTTNWWENQRERRHDQRQQPVSAKKFPNPQIGGRPLPQFHLETGEKKDCNAEDLTTVEDPSEPSTSSKKITAEKLGGKTAGGETDGKKKSVDPNNKTESAIIRLSNIRIKSQAARIGRYHQQIIGGPTAAGGGGSNDSDGDIHFNALSVMWSNKRGGSGDPKRNVTIVRR